MNVAAATRDLLDRRLGRVSMYRLVLLVLIALVVVAVVHTGVGDLGEGLWTVRGQATSLVVLLVAVTLPSWAIGRIVGVPAHLASSVITALLLFFLFVPQEGGIKLAWIAVAGVLAALSKYVVVWRGRHVLNPAAAGAFGTYLVQRIADVDPLDRQAASWWIASADLLPYVAVGAFVVLWRTRRLGLGVLFVAVAWTLVVLALHDFGTAFPEAARIALETSPLLFFAGFMLSEPLTLPPRRHQQWIVAGVMAVVYAYPLASLLVVERPQTFFVGDQWQVAALLVGNLVAFAFARRMGVRLELIERRDHGDGTHELVFRPRSPLRFEPGQYLELHVPHAEADGRGVRRVFSIASPVDAETVHVGLRVPDPSSSFKRELVRLEPGAVVRATGVAGDFVLPGDRSVPLALVAGGIGVTPFLSHLAGGGRDVVLVYGLPDGGTVPFADRLSGCRVVIVAPTCPSPLPEGWTWIESPVLTAAVVIDAVPDLASRHVYVSGPPAMVNAVRPGLRRHARKIRTDYFSGY